MIDKNSKINSSLLLNYLIVTKGNKRKQSAMYSQESINYRRDLKRNGKEVVGAIGLSSH